MKPCFAGALLCMAASVAYADSKVSPLVFTPISSPETIVSGPGAIAAGGKGSLILPPGVVRIASGETGDIAIGSDIVKIGWKSGPDFSISSVGKKTQPLHPIPKAYGLQSSQVGLSGDKRYLLAFPVARLNHSDTESFALVWYRAGFAQTATIDGDVVWFYDTDTNGVFDTRQDTMRIGPADKGPVFAPIDEYFATAKGIYHIDDLAADGKSLKYSPYTGVTGKAVVVYSSSNTHASLILLSDDGKMNAVATTSKKGNSELILLPGDYHASVGIITLGGMGTIAAVIDPTTIPLIKVVPSQTATLNIGAPYKLNFTVARENDKFRIDPATFRVKGSAGEHYIQIQWTQMPEVSVVIDGKAKPDGKISFGREGGLGVYLGGVPAANGEIKFIVTGTLNGLGAIKGEAVLK